MLRAIIADPTPGPSVTAAAEAPVVAGKNSALGESVKAQLLAQFDAAYDSKAGGWGTIHKFIDSASIEYEMNANRHGDASAGAAFGKRWTAGGIDRSGLGRGVSILGRWGLGASAL